MCSLSFPSPPCPHGGLGEGAHNGLDLTPHTRHASSVFRPAGLPDMLPPRLCASAGESFKAKTFLSRRDAEPQRGIEISVCAKITSDFGGSAAGPDARRLPAAAAQAGKGGSVSPRDTRPTEQRSRWPGAAPPRRAGGLGRAGCVAPRSQTARVCSLVAPCQPAQSPPAKSELIFAQTLSQHRRVGPACRGGAGGSRGLHRQAPALM